MTATLTRERLTAALRETPCGEPVRVPEDTLVRLIRPAGGGGVGVPLTPRQTTVLALMANGHGNAAIARTLRCSEHTVKNVIYELMGRLQARNRAHAVALAVRAGLV